MFLFEYFHGNNTSRTIRLDECASLLCELPQGEMNEHRFVYRAHHQVYVPTVGPTMTTADISSEWSGFIHIRENVFRRVVRVFHEQGMRAAFHLARSELNAVLQPFQEKLIRYHKRFKVILFIDPPQIKPEDLENYVETRDWMNSVVRCLAWHPQTNKYAVANYKDVVQAYTVPKESYSSFSSSTQEQITCMAWRPICGNEIAVGCDKGLFIWSLEKKDDPMFEFFEHPEESPVVSMQWNKYGTLLAAASIYDSVIMLLYPERKIWKPIKCYGPPISMLKWTVDSEMLFSSTTDTTFCIWDSDNFWVPEHSELLSGSIQSACWSPCATFLLFVTTTEPLLYRLAFKKEKIFKKNTPGNHFTVYPIANLRQRTIHGSVVGGMPQQLAWDCEAKCLCITFKDSDCIAVYHTYLENGRLLISPAFFIKELELNVFPSVVCFQSKHLRNNATVLSIGWSLGLVEHFALP